MSPSPLRKAVSDAYLADEDALLETLIEKARLSPARDQGHRDAGRANS